MERTYNHLQGQGQGSALSLSLSFPSSSLGWVCYATSTWRVYIQDIRQTLPVAMVCSMSHCRC